MLLAYFGNNTSCHDIAKTAKLLFIFIFIFIFF